MATNPNRVFISAGEASGDAYGAALVKEIRAKGEANTQAPINFEAIGGPKLAEQGVEIVADSRSWGVISIAQSLMALPRIIAGYYPAKWRLSRGTPGLFIPIDFGYANIRLARHAKNRGWKVLYFIPPGSWRRHKQGADLPKVSDAIVTPFEWSARILNDLGGRAYWFGHPIKDLLHQPRESPSVIGDYLAVLPGSRAHELEANLPVIADALRTFPTPVVFALAPALDPEPFLRRWEKLSGRAGDLASKAGAVSVLVSARAALVCSGTATLEAALCRCPMVVMYKLTAAMQREAKLIRMKRPKFVALPNILLDRFAIPEMIHLDAVPDAIRNEIDTVWSDGESRQAQLAAFEEIDQILGDETAIARTADLAIEMLRP